jgi:hypothetical protein
MVSQRFFAVGAEGTYGTEAASGTIKCIKVTSMGDPTNRSPAFEEAIDTATYAFAAGGPYKVSGTLEGLFRFGNMIPLLNSVCGASVSTDWNLTDTPVSLTAIVGDDQGNSQTLYTGVGMKSLELTFATKEFVKSKWGWIGQASKVLTANIAKPVFTEQSTGTDPISEPSVFYNMVLTVGGSNVTAKQMTMTIDRKFDEDYYFIGSPSLQGLYMNGITDINGTMTFGGGEWTRLKSAMMGTGTADGTGLPGTKLDPAKNELGSGALVILMKDKDGNTLGSIRTANQGKVVFTEMNRSVQGRNQFEKTITYKIIAPQSTDFVIRMGA